MQYFRPSNIRKNVGASCAPYGCNSLFCNTLPASPYSRIFYRSISINKRNNSNKSNSLRKGDQRDFAASEVSDPEPVGHSASSNQLTSSLVKPRLEVVLCNGHSHQWGRHGFDGDACGQEACRGAHTRNRVQNDNCQSTDGIRSLIS